MPNPNPEAQLSAEQKSEAQKKNPDDPKKLKDQADQTAREVQALAQNIDPQRAGEFLQRLKTVAGDAETGSKNLEIKNSVEQGTNKSQLDNLANNSRVQSLQERGRLDPKLQEQLPEVQQKLQANLEKAKGLLAGKTELASGEARQLIDATVGEKNGLRGEAAKIYRGQFCEELNKILAGSQLTPEQKSDLLVNMMAEQRAPHDSIKSSLWKSMRAAEKDLPLGTPADRQKIEDLMAKGEAMPFSQPLKIGGKEFAVKNAKVLIGGQMVDIDPTNMATFKLKDVVKLPDGKVVARMQNGCESNFMILEGGELKTEKPEAKTETETAQPKSEPKNLYPDQPLDGRATTPLESQIDPDAFKDLRPDQFDIPPVGQAGAQGKTLAQPGENAKKIISPEQTENRNYLEMQNRLAIVTRKIDDLESNAEANRMILELSKMAKGNQPIPKDFEARIQQLEKNLGNQKQPQASTNSPQSQQSTEQPIQGKTLEYKIKPGDLEKNPGPQPMGPAKPGESQGKKIPVFEGASGEPAQQQDKTEAKQTAPEDKAESEIKVPSNLNTPELKEGYIALVKKIQQVQKQNSTLPYDKQLAAVDSALKAIQSSSNPVDRAIYNSNRDNLSEHTKSEIYNKIEAEIDKSIGILKSANIDASSAAEAVTKLDEVFRIESARLNEKLGTANPEKQITTTAHTSLEGAHGNRLYGIKEKFGLNAPEKDLEKVAQDPNLKGVTKIKALSEVLTKYESLLNGSDAKFFKVDEAIARSFEFHVSREALNILAQAAGGEANPSSGKIDNLRDKKLDGAQVAETFGKLNTALAEVQALFKEAKIPQTESIYALRSIKTAYESAGYDLMRQITQPYFREENPAPASGSNFENDMTLLQDLASKLAYPEMKTNVDNWVAELRKKQQ